MDNNLLGIICNVIIAVCALATVVMTICENKRIRAENKETRTKQTKLKNLDDLCTSRILTCFDESKEDVMRELNSLVCDDEEVRTVYMRVDSILSNCVNEVSYLKIIDKSLFDECDGNMSALVDTIADYFNKEEDNGLDKETLREKCIKEIRKQEFEVIKRIYRYRDLYLQ